MNIKKIALIIFSIAVIVSLLSVAGATVPANATGVSNFWVGVSPSDHSGHVNQGATVFIYWDGVTPANAAVDITVYDPSGAVIATYPGMMPSDSGTLSFVASQLGTYYVRADGFPSYHQVTTFVAGASLIVLPESVLGTLAVLASCAGAVAVFGVVKKKRANKA
jgi:hypothetical protein